MKLVMVILALLGVLGAADWKQVKASDGITVYTRTVEGSDYLEFRGETVVEGSVAALVAILYDTPAAPRWLHQCSFGMTLEEVRFEENYIFERYDLPFPVSNRQVILHSKLIWNDDGARLETRESNGYCDDHPLKRCQTVEESGLIALSRSRGYYHFTPLGDGRSKVVWQQHTEPGGTLPSWLVSALVVDIPFNSLQQMRALAQEPKYRDMTEHALREKWARQYEQYH